MVSVLSTHFLTSFFIGERSGRGNHPLRGEEVKLGGFPVSIERNKKKGLRRKRERGTTSGTKKESAHRQVAGFSRNAGEGVKKQRV